jgi:hypothetical protein
VACRQTLCNKPAALNISNTQKDPRVEMQGRLHIIQLMRVTVLVDQVTS